MWIQLYRWRCKWWRVRVQFLQHCKYCGFKSETAAYFCCASYSHQDLGFGVGTVWFIRFSIQLSIVLQPAATIAIIMAATATVIIWSWKRPGRFVYSFSIVGRLPFDLSIQAVKLIDFGQSHCKEQGGTTLCFIQVAAKRRGRMRGKDGDVIDATATLKTYSSSVPYSRISSALTVMFLLLPRLSRPNQKYRPGLGVKGRHLKGGGRMWEGGVECIQLGGMMRPIS